MATGTLRAAGLAIVLALAALALAACGSDGGGTTTASQPPAIPAETAGHLAKLSDRIASDLDSGDTCHAAHAADDLRVAVDESQIPASMRPDIESVAGNLVDEVNCPPPPPPAPEPKPKKNPNDGRHGDEQVIPPGQAKHGGVGPPGHEKLKGEPE